MNMVKKIFSLCLALTLLLSLAVPAMAEGTVDHSNHKITIENEAENRQYTAYQIFKGSVQIKTSTVNGVTTTDKVLTSIAWGDHIAPQTKVDGLDLLEALKSPTKNPNSYKVYENIKPVQGPTEKEPAITWDDVAAAVADALGKNDSVANGLIFADIVSKYLRTDIPDEELKISSREGNAYVIQPLTDGYYLVKDTTAQANLAPNEVRSLFMMQLVEDSTATPKPSSVSIVKRIVEGTNISAYDVDSSGDEVEFAIQGTVPSRIASYPSFYYSIEDIMAAGFTLVENSIKVSIYNNAQERVLDNEDKGTGTDKLYNVQVTEALNATTNKNDTKITVTIPDLIALDKSEKYTVLGTSYIVVTYKARLNNSATLGGNGNNNNVKLTYTEDPHNPTEKNTTVQQDVDVFTFGLDVTKIDGSTNEKLNGAEFVLYRSRGGQHQHALVNEQGFVYEWVTDELDTLKTELATKKADTNQTDALKAEIDALTAKINDMTLVTETVDTEKGKLLIKGLDEDTYWLKEVTPPVGYQLLEEPYQFQIDAIFQENVTQQGGTVKPYVLTGLQLIPRAGSEVPGDKDTGYVAVSIVNNPGHTLPETGGIGTTIFYVVGGILAAGALVLLITRKRMYE